MNDGVKSKLIARIGCAQTLSAPSSQIRSPKTSVLKKVRHSKKSGVVRNSGILAIMFVLAISFITILPSGLVKSSAQAVGPWSATTVYPQDIADHSCVTSSGYIYCVGGYTGSVYLSDVYFAAISPSGVGSWASTTSYPETVAYESCVASSTFIYCVGGFNSTGYSNYVAYAPISAAGVGVWSQTTSYPMEIQIESCALSSGYIYCVGGADSGGSPVSNVYYAPVSASGVGAWTATTAYPSGVFGQSCQIYSGYIYCVGDINDVYYAPVSHTGVGTWVATTNYPTIGVFEPSCVIILGYMYCVAGSTGAGYTDLVYYAEVSSTGIGAWSSTSDYPLSVIFFSCVGYSGYIYCVGGLTSGGTITNAVYYTEIPPAGITLIDAENWAGYALNSSVADSITQIKGSWIIPAVDCSGIPGVQSIAVVVAIDGYAASKTVPRDGFMVESTCENGIAFYPASYIFGTSSSFFNYTNPGDNVSMKVVFSGGHFHMTFDDVTGGWSRTFTVSDPSATRQSAEWMVELVKSPLLNFGVAVSGKVYTAIAASDNAIISGHSGTIGSFAGTSVEVVQQNMVDSGGNLMAVASPLTKTGSSFYVQWLAAS